MNCGLVWPAGEGGTRDRAIRSSGGSSDTLEAREGFRSTLGLQRGCGSFGQRLSAPAGLALHGIAVVALLLAALWSPIEDLAPGPARRVLAVAPPPPPPLRQGSPAGLETPVMELARTDDSLFVPDDSSTARPPSIPEEMLNPHFDVPRGVEDGFMDGSRDGMSGGIPGGVVGGVPGGLVGGVVGGVGTELPSFPVPDVGPSPIRVPPPSYTRQAIRDNVSGAVVLRVVIDERGSVQVLKVLRSIPELDSEAIRVVESRWRFQPATKNGRPVPTLSDLVVRFNLY